MRYRVGARLALWLLLALSMNARVLVVTISTTGEMAVIEAEELEINGSEKVRALVTGAPVPATFDPKALGRLAAIPIERCNVIRRTPQGMWVAQSGALKDWQTLLPDGLKAKAPGAPLELWKSSSVNIRRTNKDKTGEALPVETIYAIVPGENTQAAALTLATSLTHHTVPGSNDAAAFAAMVKLMPAVIKTWPTGPTSEKIKEEMRSLFSGKLTAWAAGDAEVLTLEQALLLGAASEAAFAGDATFVDLRKQATDAKAWLDRRAAILRALNAGKQPDAFLLSYREFEPYDRSFPELVKARAEHLKLSADLHVAMAERLRNAGDYGGAVRNLRIAQMRDPNRAEITKLLEHVRLEVARITSEQFAQTRKGVDPRSPGQVQLQRRLRLLEQLLADGKLAEADAALKEADAIDKDEPRIRFLQAQLEIARGDLGTALAVLDLYAGMAITPQDFEEGEKLRAKVLYDIQTLRKNRRSELTTLASNEQFATALQQAADGLKVDNEEPSFLFEAGVNACILRQCQNAGPLLRRFLDLTDSTSGDRKQRISAQRLLARTKQSSEPAIAAVKDASWFSGTPLEKGVLYDPVSLMFQPKVAQVRASDHLTIQYLWNGNNLKSVHAKYEDKKTGSNIRSVITGLAITGSATLRSADRETNDFYFNYYDDVPQVLSVNHDNQVVQSQKRQIRVPALGLTMLSGGLGAVGSIGALGNLGAMGGLGNMGAMGGLGNMGALSGLGNMGAMSGLGNMGAMANLRNMGSAMNGMTNLTSAYNTAAQYSAMARTALDARSTLVSTGQTYSVHSDPKGGSSKRGLVTLWNSPRIDTEVAEMARGKRVTMGFAGNKYFHPFAWSGIHMFEFAYDSVGRVKHAWEIDEPNAPRLDFTWDGKRLMSITAHDAQGGVPYSRRMTYNGDRLISELITFGGKTSKIEYKYDRTGRLTEARCDEDPSLDNRSRQIEFVADAAPAKR